MSGSSSKESRSVGGQVDEEAEITPLVELLGQQDLPMQSLFARALNLYAAPGADAIPEREKLDRLKQAIEESLEG